MVGDTEGPRVDAGEVSYVARFGERTWRIDEGGRTWRLTRDDLMAIDESWSGDPDDLSLAIAEAIAVALNARRPWRRPEDDHVPTEPVPEVAGIGFLAACPASTAPLGHDPGS